MDDNPFVSLTALGRMFSDPDLPLPHRDTLVRRGRKVASDHGWQVTTVNGHGFVARADVDRLAQGSAA